MDQCVLHTFIALVWNLSFLYLVQCSGPYSNPASCNRVIPISKSKSPSTFHTLMPSSKLCAGAVKASRRCTLTFRVEDEFMRLITQLCTEGAYYVYCRGRMYSASLKLSTSTERLTTIKCREGYEHQSHKFCAPRGEDLTVQYKGNFFCSDDIGDSIREFLDVYLRDTFSNIRKLTKNHHCDHNGRSKKANGTVISVYKPDNQGGLVLCPVSVRLNYGVEKEFCMKFLSFITYGSGATLMVKAKTLAAKYIEEKDQVTTQGDICMTLDKKDDHVMFSVQSGYPTETGKHHLFLFEFYTIYKEESDDDDDDDDNDDLYWLFVIPGVAILICCCYYCCKEDKDEIEGGETAPRRSSESEADVPLQDGANASDRGSRGGGVGEGDRVSVEMTSSPFAQPSAPPVEEPPPPLIGSGGGGGGEHLPPPSYFSLFPDQKSS